MVKAVFDPRVAPGSAKEAVPSSTSPSPKHFSLISNSTDNTEFTPLLLKAGELLIVDTSGAIHRERDAFLKGIVQPLISLVVNERQELTVYPGIPPASHSSTSGSGLGTTHGPSSYNSSLAIESDAHLCLGDRNSFGVVSQAPSELDNLPEAKQRFASATSGELPYLRDKTYTPLPPTVCAAHITFQITQCENNHNSEHTIKIRVIPEIPGERSIACKDTSAEMILKPTEPLIATDAVSHGELGSLCLPHHLASPQRTVAVMSQSPTVEQQQEHQEETMHSSIFSQYNVLLSRDFGATYGSAPKQAVSSAHGYQTLRDIGAFERAYHKTPVEEPLYIGRRVTNKAPHIHQYSIEKRLDGAGHDHTRDSARSKLHRIECILTRKRDGSIELMPYVPEVSSNKEWRCNVLIQDAYGSYQRLSQPTVLSPGTPFYVGGFRFVVPTGVVNNKSK